MTLSIYSKTEKCLECKVGVHCHVSVFPTQGKEKELFSGGGADGFKMKMEICEEMCREERTSNQQEITHCSGEIRGREGRQLFK